MNRMKNSLILFFLCSATAVHTSYAGFVGNMPVNMLTKGEQQDSKTHSEQTLPGNIAEIIDVPYINDGRKGHLLDIYYPGNREGPFPVVVDIHGGGFVSD